MILEIQALKKTFNTGRPSELQALRGIHLSISPGDFLVVVGSNGSGKSTLLNCIAGSVIPQSGQIRLNGKEISRLPSFKRSPWIGRVFQDPLAGTAPSLSILDNFRLAALRTESKGLKLGVTPQFRRQVAEHIAPLGMGLENLLDQPMGTLSGGQRQALTLLMTTMAPLQLLLLDEPTAALDPRSARMVMQLTAKLIRQYKLTALLVTHNMQEALQYGNRLVQMQEGEIKRIFSPEEKKNLTQSDLLDWFNYPA